MSDYKIPPPGRKSGHLQSQDDRDAEGLAARRERDAAVKALEDDEEEVTGRHEGEDLAALRSLRPERERISRLERKHDDLKRDVKEKHEELKADVKDVRDDVKQLSSSVSTLSASVSGAVGKLDGQSGVLTEMLSLVKKTADRDHVTYTTKLEVDKAHELAKVEVDKEQQLAAIEVTKEEKVAEIVVVKEEKVDVVKAKRDRRKRNIKILSLVASGIAGGAAFIELLHRIGVL
jgi:hypothetical protein